MIFINHRVNQTSILRTTEIVEIDVWGNDLRMGHDGPTGEPVPVGSLRCKQFWFHAKDFNAFQRLLLEKAICFMHDIEPIAQVSNGKTWTTMPCMVDSDTVFMDVAGTKYTPGEVEIILNGYGICSDDLHSWRAIYGNR